jgi:Neuraminidase (sialidase)
VPRRAFLVVAASAFLVPAAIAASNGLVLATPGPSPFSACTADQADTQQAAGSTLYPNAEVEPRADVNPTDRSNIVGEYQQDRWSDGGARGLVTSVTRNGGSSWHRVVVPGITKCSGGVYDRASDPWLSFAPNGDLYSISLSFDVFDPQDAIIVSKSTNGGETWGAPIPIVAENTDGLDKQSITADPLDARFAYAVWDIFQSRRVNDYAQPTYFSRTTDGGQTWERPRVLYNPGINSGTIGSIVNVLPNGDLVDGLLTFSDRKHGVTQISVIRSTDRGRNWAKPVAVATVDTNYSNTGPTDPDNGQAIRGGELPDFAVDPANGTLYTAWEDDVPVPGVGSIFFAQSTDGGNTWSQPVKINRTPTSIPPGNQTAFTPTVKVAANGVVGVTYYDLRNNTADPGLPTDAWLVRCSAGCTTAASWKETHVAGPFDEEQAPVAVGYFLGDYEGMVTLHNAFAPFFTQAVTRAGNPTDAFFVRLP